MQTTPASESKATILIVDDEPDVREVLEEYFSSHGYTALCADGAASARTLAAERAIDLALVDIHLPGEDGLSWRATCANVMRRWRSSCSPRRPR